MPLDDIVIREVLLRIGAAILVFLIGRWLAHRARTVVHVNLSKTTIAPSMARLLLLLVYYSILLATVITSLALLGLPLTGLLTASLVIVVILGIALQQSISNLAATIMFMLFQPFKVGELIKSNDVMGDVKEIQFFSTVLVTGNNLEVTLPNAKIQGDTLYNYTRLGKVRIDFVFGIGYESDMAKAKRLLSDILAADPRVLADPEPLIFVKELGDSSVNLASWPWVKPEDYWTLQWDLPGRVKQSFDAEGISIPYPQRDVHLFQVSPPAAVRPQSSEALNRT